MKAIEYNWGEFKGEGNLTKQDLKAMRELTESEMVGGFSIRDEDKTKVFYALEEYIDSDASGTAVKFAYAVERADKMRIKPSERLGKYYRKT